MRNFEATRLVTISEEITKDWVRTGTIAISTRNQLKLTRNHNRTQASCFQYGQEMANKARKSKGGGTGEDSLKQL